MLSSDQVCELPQHSWFECILLSKKRILHRTRNFSCKSCVISGMMPSHMPVCTVMPIRQKVAMIWSSQMFCWWCKSSGIWWCVVWQVLPNFPLTSHTMIHHHITGDLHLRTEMYLRVAVLLLAHLFNYLNIIHRNCLFSKDSCTPKQCPSLYQEWQQVAKLAVEICMLPHTHPCAILSQVSLPGLASEMIALINLHTSTVQVLMSHA